MKLLKLDQPVKDPTTMTGEELVHEIQDVLKGLLEQGAKLPKNLMLYVKDMIFFDGATTRLAPDVNLFEQVTRIYAYFGSTTPSASRATSASIRALLPLDLAA